MLEALMNSPIAWLILAVATIGSFIYAFYCQKTNKERKEISYLIQSEHLIRKKRLLFKNIKLIYHDQELDNVCYSKIAIWNSGNRVINDTDIANTQSLCIVAAEGVSILDYHLFISEKCNKVSIESVGFKKLIVSFEYLNPSDGIALFIAHSGEKNDLGVDGNIKGGMPINCRKSPSSFEKNESSFLFKLTKKKWFHVVYSVLFNLFFVFLFFATFVDLLSQLNVITLEPISITLFPSSGMSKLIFTIILLVLILCSYIVVKMQVYNLKRYSVPIIPEKLRDFFNPYL